MKFLLHVTLLLTAGFFFQVFFSTHVKAATQCLESGSSASQEEQSFATVEVQYDGQYGSGKIQMTNNPYYMASISRKTQITATLNTTSQDTSCSISSVSPAQPTLSKTSVSLRIPPPFGVTRSQMFNSTRTTSYMFSKATGSSPMSGVVGSQGISELKPTLNSARANTIWTLITWSTVANLVFLAL